LEHELLLNALRGAVLVGRDAALMSLRARLDKRQLLPAGRCLIGCAGKSAATTTPSRADARDRARSGPAQVAGGKLRGRYLRPRWSQCDSA
jgi:hypothetical protein